MKILKKFFKKTSVFIAASIFATILISLLITYFLSLPTLRSYRSLKPENKKLEQEIEVLSRSISSVSSLDREEINELYSKVNSLIPEGKDVLRVLTLSEILARASGVQILDVSVQTQTAASGQPQAPSAPAPAGVQTPPLGNKYSLGITIKGNFKNILTLVSNLKAADRLMGINDLAIKGEDDDLEAQLQLEVPLEASTTSVSAGEDVILTDQEKQAISELISKLGFSASPAENPLGIPNPFK